MAAPDPDAPSTLVIDVRTGALSLEIVDHESRVVAYAVEGLADCEGVSLKRLDALAGPYRVWKEPGRLWRCDCESFKFRKGRFAPYGCKHVASVRPLIPFALDLIKGVPVATKTRTKDEPRRPTPAAAAEPQAVHAPPPGEAAVEAAHGAEAIEEQIGLTARLILARVDAKEYARALSDVTKALADPFPASVVGWKPQTAKDNRALAVAYIDARDVMDRLDATVGIDGWQDQYDEAPDGTVRCILSLKLGGEWVARQDVGGESEQKDPGDRKKAAYSDALKRAAVKWGIGRYLYSLPATWADYDPQRRDFVRPPQLPAWALPGGSGRPGVQSPAQQTPPRQAPPPPAPAQADSSAFAAKLEEYDGKLALQGLCAPGDLVKAVAAAGKRSGFPAEMTAWNPDQIRQARELTKDFESRRRLVAEVQALLELKGATTAQVNAKVKAPAGAGLHQLTTEQLTAAVTALSQMDDAEPAGNGRRAS